MQELSACRAKARLLMLFVILNVARNEQSEGSAFDFITFTEETNRSFTTLAKARVAVQDDMTDRLYYLYVCLRNARY
jgi:hypothetical protein